MRLTNILVKMPRDNTKSKRIILELLHNPDGKLTKYGISKETGTNISWVIYFLKKLEEKKIVEDTMVINIDELIDNYISLDKKISKMDFHIPGPLDYFKKSKKEYMLTTYAAENLISHSLFPSRIDVYVKKEDREEWKKELFKKGLIGKGNLRLIVAHDNYLFKFKKIIKDLNVATIPLLMIDLKREGGVCLEAYKYLL